MSALSLLSIPLKKSGEVDLVKPFRNAIASSFCGAGPSEIEKYNEAIAELNRMRNNACAKPLDKHESALETVYRYHDQLGALERKVPPGEFQVAFKWKDAFDKGSFFAGSKSLTISSLTFEKACVLFNMAALQSQVASAQNMEHDDGLKLAAKLFQLSSGVLAHLKGIVLSCVSQEPTPDLFPETLHALSALMMAQAQEVFVNKAIQDKMKDVSVAKLAAQCGELYTEAARLMSSEKVKYIWDREWLPIVNSKQEGYKALAEFYQASVCEASKKIGERITRLQQAADLMKSSSSKGGAYFPSFLSDFSGRIQHSLEAARKENDFIYHDRVPDIKTCEAVAKVALAKSLPYQDRYSQQSRDLFEDLVPLEVSTFLAIAESKKTEMINVEVAKMRDASQLLNGLLASMNLPAALEDSGDSKELPPSLKDKQKKIKAEGGAKALNDALRALPDLLQRNREILDETERALDEERESDTELRTRFKEKWKRTESDKLTGAFKENANRYRQIIDNAVSADAIVKDKFEKHRGAIELLSNKSEAEVLAALPSGKGGNKDSPAAKKLMMLMHAVDDLKKEREELEKAFKTADPDLKNALCSALAREGRVDPEIARRALETTYGPILEKTAGNLGKQERIVAEVQEANGEFTRGHGNETGTREAMMKQLAAAYDAFMELKGNLKEGTDFYNDLTQILVNFQNKVTDFCFARKTEKDELMKDLTSAMASVKLDSAPSQPRHFGPDAGAKKEPPPRPPPPAASTPNVPTSNAPPYSVPPYNPQAYNPVQPGMVGDYSQQHQQYQHQQQPQMQQPTHAMPYPTQPQGMPLPYSYPQQPYPSYTPPMPAGYNPYGYMPPGQQQPQQQQQQHQQQQGYPYQYPNQAPGYPPYQQQQQHQPQGNPGSCQQQ